MGCIFPITEVTGGFNDDPRPDFGQMKPSTNFLLIYMYTVNGLDIDIYIYIFFTPSGILHKYHNMTITYVYYTYVIVIVLNILMTLYMFVLAVS